MAVKNKLLNFRIDEKLLSESKERVILLSKKIPNYSLSEHIRSLLVLDQKENIVDARVAK